MYERYVEQQGASHKSARDRPVHKYDVILQDMTGSGKTLAYLLPLLSEIDATKKKIQAVVMLPTRELALQVSRIAALLLRGGSSYSKKKPRRYRLVIGQPCPEMVRELRTSPPHLLIGTPQTLHSLVFDDEVKSVALDACKYLVLDEADLLVNSKTYSSSVLAFLTQRSGMLRGEEPAMLHRQLAQRDAGKRRVSERLRKEGSDEQLRAKVSLLQILDPGVEVIQEVDPKSPSRVKHYQRDNDRIFSGGAKVPQAHADEANERSAPGHHGHLNTSFRQSVLPPQPPRVILVSSTITPALEEVALRHLVSPKFVSAVGASHLLDHAVNNVFRQRTLRALLDNRKSTLRAKWGHAETATPASLEKPASVIGKPQGRLNAPDAGPLKDLVQCMPVRILPDTINHYFMVFSQRRMLTSFSKLHAALKPRVVLVFMKSATDIDELAVVLRGKNFRVVCIHAQSDKASRIEALEGARKGTVDFVLTTDMLARGVDIKGISHVISVLQGNFSTVSQYVHRAGRVDRIKGKKHSTVITMFCVEQELIDVEEGGDLGWIFPSLFPPLGSDPVVNIRLPTQTEGDGGESKGNVRQYERSSRAFASYELVRAVSSTLNVVIPRLLLKNGVLSVVNEHGDVDPIYARVKGGGQNTDEMEARQEEEGQEEIEREIEGEGKEKHHE